MNNIILDTIDEPCKGLLSEVQRHMEIVFELRTDGVREYDYQTIERDGNSVPIKGRIRYYEPIESCKIAHELLHAKCSFSLGYDKAIYNIVEKVSTITSRQVLTYEMCESILNQTEHYIFYNEYINMGYESSKFVESISFPENEWRIFAKNYKSDTLSVTDIINLINTLHHILLFPIDNRFKTEIQQLKHMERDLFDAFKRFKKSLPDISLFTEGQTFPLEKQYEVLIKSIDAWCKSKETW